MAGTDQNVLIIWDCFCFELVQFTWLLRFDVRGCGMWGRRRGGGRSVTLTAAAAAAEQIASCNTSFIRDFRPRSQNSKFLSHFGILSFNLLLFTFLFLFLLLWWSRCGLSLFLYYSLSYWPVCNRQMRKPLALGDKNDTKKYSK